MRGGGFSQSNNKEFGRQSQDEDSPQQQKQQMMKYGSQQSIGYQNVDLRNRLYDKGFKPGTMLSVKRPENVKSKDTVLIANLTNMQKRGQKNEKIVYQP